MKKLLLIVPVLVLITGFISYGKPDYEVKLDAKKFTVYKEVDGSYVKQTGNVFPKGGYILNTTESSCTNGGVISQNNNTKEISVTMTSPDKCNFYFDESDLATDIIYKMVEGSPSNTVDVITKDAPSGATCTNTLAYDGTTDNNLRYVGSNPCNYVTFNGETAGWRIVGIMTGVDDGTGVTETRIKLIRATSLGNYSWDTSTSGVNGATSNYGINDWTQADLKNELNGDYLNTNLNANTMWCNGSSDQQTATFDYTKRLSAGAQELIGDAKWYLGGHYTEADRIPSTMYTKERGTTVWGSASGQTCEDAACPRATEWTGKVALIYPSDYGYATAGGTTTNRSACIGSLTTYNNTSGESWTNSSYSDCQNNDWLKPSSGYNWLLSPRSNHARYAFYVYDTGSVYHINASSSSAVLPAVYLQSGVTISGGNGSAENPFTLSLTS